MLFSEIKNIFIHLLDIFVHCYNPEYNKNVSAVLQEISLSIWTM